jgi:hypothetical protein
MSEQGRPRYGIAEAYKKRVLIMVEMSDSEFTYGYWMVVSSKENLRRYPSIFWRAMNSPLD